MPDNNHRRKPIISGNWKMNLNHFEALQTVQKLHYSLPKEVYDSVDVTVHPPFTDLRTVQTSIDADELDIKLGAQNCHWEDNGAFTGEISPGFLEKLNVQFVIVGHSERRQMFGETDATVNKKIKAVFKHNMIPIMAVGETLEEREAGEMEAVCLSQLIEGLKGLQHELVPKVIIAYEPIWAIGTGRTATADDAQTMCKAIRTSIEAKYGADTAAAVRIQYGGSVKAGTTTELMAQPDVDGALVGGASLDPDEFARIIQHAAESDARTR